MPTFPKPTPRARAKAAEKRLQARLDRDVYAAVHARDNGRCRACGHFGLMHRHHIVYRSQGGQTTPENVCLLCLECHEAVHARRIRVTGSAEADLRFARMVELI